jgi:hydroxylamine reductase
MDILQLSPHKQRLLGELIGLARATEGNDHLLQSATGRLVCDALAALIDESADLDELFERIDREKRRLVPMCYECLGGCGRNNAYDVLLLRLDAPGLRTAKYALLDRLLAAASHPQGREQGLYLGLYALGREDWPESQIHGIHP